MKMILRLMTVWLMLLLMGTSQSLRAKEAQETPAFVLCEGKYAGHLQGVCRDEGGDFFWSFTRALVKTNPQGKVLKKIPVADHHGDVCLVNGKVYCARESMRHICRECAEMRVAIFSGALLGHW